MLHVDPSLAYRHAVQMVHKRRGVAYLGPDDPHFVPSLMPRVRVGLIGLSAVFLLVAMAAALLRATGSEGVVNGSAAELAVANATGPNEPLAQLGVAPGNAPPAAAPTAAPKPGRAPR